MAKHKQSDEGRNPNVSGAPESRHPKPLSAEGETVDANPPLDEPVAGYEGPVYEDDEEPDHGDKSPRAREE